MTVDTGKVAGRRELHFESVEEILAEAERLAAVPKLISLGNWSLAQVILHIANTMQKSIDGFDTKAPWFIRLLGKLIRKRMLTKPMPSGFKLPPPAAKELVADEFAATQEALTALRSAIGRLGRESNREPHPALGRLSCEQWNQLHMRHAELHLSFLTTEEE